MSHLSVSHIFLVFVSESAISLQPAFTLSPLLSLPPQHLAGLQPAIILALMDDTTYIGVFIYPAAIYMHGYVSSRANQTLDSN
jgi:hypothetical protein